MATRLHWGGPADHFSDADFPVPIRRSNLDYARNGPVVVPFDVHRKPKLIWLALLYGCFLGSLFASDIGMRFPPIVAVKPDIPLT
jgi:hypothetical protein